MSTRSTESLLHDLAQGLPAVRPIPRVGVVVAAVLGVFGVVVVLNGWLGFPAPDFGRAVWSDFLFLALLSCLGAVALAGTWAALTRAIPGRETEGQIATLVALAGLLGAIGFGIAASVGSGGFGEALPVQSSLMCTLRGAALGLLPSLGVVLFLGRALTRRPMLVSLLALLGAVGLGACFVHASCTSGNALHVLFGHASAPLVATLVLLLPCTLAVKLLSMHFGARD